LHDSAAYFEHPYLEARRGAVKIETPARRFAIAALRRCMVLERLRGARLLDVGCDIGTFAGWAAQAFGVIPLGVDVARRAVDEARRRGIDAYHTDLEHAPPDLSNLPLITAIDVIEHVSDPRAFLQALRDRLSPGGLAYVQTPNIRSAIYRLGCMLSRMSAGWSSGVVTRIFPAEHAQYFNRESLRVAAGQAWLEIPYLSTRVLQGKEIAASWPVRLLMIALQILDRLTGREILICAVLQRPASKTGTDS
jgi:cyclopropane fatty-acyl-phospholipid synthase-like methyltransferase